MKVERYLTVISEIPELKSKEALTIHHTIYTPYYRIWEMWKDIT